MSKFILPSQKGTELFPNAVVAPPIVRWVGIDARSTEAQAILAQYGSALTAFHAQQSHNHSLSGNTQSRAARQIAPNLGVTYVNQGGTEYVTLDVKPAATQIDQRVAAPDTETPRVQAPSTLCWFPASQDGLLISESLGIATREQVTSSYFSDWSALPDIGFEMTLFGQKFRSLVVSSAGGVYVDIIGADPDFDPYTRGTNDVPTYVSDTGKVIPLGVRPSVVGSRQAADIGTGWARYPCIAPFLQDGSLDVGYDYRAGSKVFGGEAFSRKYLNITWTLQSPIAAYVTYNALFGRIDTSFDYSANSVVQLTLIEGVGRCPALVGFSYLDVYGHEPFRDQALNTPPFSPNLPPHTTLDNYSQNLYYAPFVGFVDYRPEKGIVHASGGRVTGSQVSNVASLVANKQLWFSLDSGRGVPTPLRAVVPWDPATFSAIP